MLILIPTFASAKDPADIDDWVMDFSAALRIPGSATYDTITNIVSISSTPPGLTVTQQAVTTGDAGPGTAVGFWLSGGAPGVTYQVTATISTALLREFSRSAFVACQAR